MRACFSEWRPMWWSALYRVLLYDCMFFPRLLPFALLKPSNSRHLLVLVQVCYHIHTPS